MSLRAVVTVSAVTLAATFMPSVVGAQTCSSYHPLKPNGETSPIFTSSTAADHISFFFRVEANRSYSVEVHQVGRDYRVAQYSMNVNSFDCPTVNMAGLRNTVSIEPSPQGSPQDIQRFSFTTTAAATMQFRAGSTAGTATIQAIATDTTLFSDWFFLGGDYSSFTLLRNTTAASVTYRVAWRSSGGAIVATSTGTLSGNGSVFLNARDFAGALAAVSGTVEITHDSTLGAILASTTVLSATTGLSFDAPFQTRP